MKPMSKERREHLWMLLENHPDSRLPDGDELQELREDAEYWRGIVNRVGPAAG